MRCPFCGYKDTKVTDSRTANNAIRRRRECLKCKHRFTTFETIDLTIQVKKRNGTYEDFQQEKILKGLDAACCHSKISHDQVRGIVAQIVTDLIAKQVREITTKELGELVMQYLQEVDEVAYIRFACVYKRFKRIEDVVGAIESIAPKNYIDKINLKK